jgi:hypothetical protein
VLHADGNLGQPAILLQHRIAEHPQLDPEDVLIEGESVPSLSAPPTSRVLKRWRA